MPSIGSSRVFDSYYSKPLRFEVYIKSNDLTKTYHYYDGFAADPATTNNIHITAIDCKRGLQQTGSFEIKIEDSDRTIDRDDVDKGNIVIIKAGKTKEDSRNIFYGIVYDLDGERDHSHLTWTLAGKGASAILQHTFVNFIRNAPTTTLNTGQQIFKKDPDFQVWKLFKQLFEDKAIYPLDRRSLVERGKFTLDGISEQITEILPSVIYPLTAAASVANAFADVVGAQWNIDEENNVVFDYPDSLSSGIIIKDKIAVDSNGSYIDNGDYTAYPIGNVRFNSSIDPSSGFANVLFGTAELVNVISGEAGSQSFESLFNKDLAQMVVPGASQLRDMTFIMSKTGAGTDAPDPAIKKLFGFVVEDEVRGTAHTPTGQIVATFGIPLSDIKEEPGPISKINLKFSPGVKMEIDKEHWIVLQEVGNSEQNTVRWWHDADNETPSEEPPYPTRLIRWSGRRLLPEGRSDGDTFSYRPWMTSSKGPVFSHAFLSGNKILTQARNVLSIARWTKGFPVEAKIDASWIKHASTMSQYLNTLVHLTGQPPVTFDTMLTTIPNILFKPGYSVQFIDDLLGFPEDNAFFCQVAEDHYWVDADNYGVGNLVCELNLKGYESPLDFHSDNEDPLLQC